jgi:hypothetical protein
MKDKFGRVYFFLFGLFVLGFGIAELIIGIAGKSFTWSILEMSGEFLVWRGFILFFAGLFYLSSVKKLVEIHQLAKVVMGSIMIWIVAGAQIFALITESIPGEKGAWLNNWRDFLSTYSPPYIPSLILLPFSLVTIYYICARKNKVR